MQAKEDATGKVREAISAQNGEFTFAGLQAGAYEVTVVVRGGRRIPKN